jgi:hypothetical protein
VAAPTNVRVESNSITTAKVRWAYGGSNSIGVYRSTDGAAYTLIGFSAVSALKFEDTALNPATKYWYKVSDDNGATYSSVVTVITHSCQTDEDGRSVFSLPRFKDEDREDDLNAMAARIEDEFSARIHNREKCLACPDDGAVVLDCVDGCKDFLIVADQDINSITMNGCDETTSVTFYVEPGVERRICGWPVTMGFDGDECEDSPIDGGTEGRTFGVSRGGGNGGGGGSSSRPGAPRSGGTGGSGGGVGGSDCECVPDEGNQLTVKCCTEDCSLDCSSTKEMEIKVCGGVGPYNVSASGLMQVQKTNGDTIAATDEVSAGQTIVIKPPANTGSAVAGVAYRVWVSFTTTAAGFCENHFANRDYGCDDLTEAGGTTGNCGFFGTPSCGTGTLSSCAAIPCFSGDCTTHVDCTGTPTCPKEESCNALATDLGTGYVCDERTSPMIAAGCNPCALSQGETITVTDAAGVSVVTTVGN